MKRNEDAALLQEDIDSLQEWANEWKMAFHPKKCELLRITRKHSPREAKYKMQQHYLKKVDSKEYLGVTSHEKVSWNDHVQHI